jgi:ADP-heptose:LPS heptosyltransferase
VAKNRPSKVLAIRLSAMGDVAMTIPVLNILARQYPNLQIVVLTKPLFKPLFKHLTTITVYEAQVKKSHKGVLGLWRLYKELKKFNIEGVADLHNVLRSRILGLFFFLNGTNLKRIDKGRNEKRALTANKNKVFKPLKFTVERYSDVFRDLGYPINLNQDWLSPKRPISSSIQKSIGKDDKYLLGIAPFAAFSGKAYPLNLMEEVISILNNTEKYNILLFGGGLEEKSITQKWEQKYNNCKSVVGKFSFDDELAIISNLHIMVGMDSGNGHLAAMFGVPTITLWGVTHPYAGFAPFGQDEENNILADRNSFPLIPTSVFGNKMPAGYEKTMLTINPKTIVSRINKVCGVI